MSVLIKGMEKPEHCGYCRFRYDGICHALQRTQYSMNECPLVVIDDAGLNDTISRHAAIDTFYKYPNIDWTTLDVLAKINALPSAQQWVPCSERLPEEYGNYLITTHDGNVDIGTIDPKKKSVWSACDADGFYWLREVVAWMPLPKPYERKES